MTIGASAGAHVKPVAAVQLAPGQTVRFTDGSPEQNGDRTVAGTATRYGTGYSFTRITWTDGTDCDFPSAELLDVVEDGALTGGRHEPEPAERAGFDMSYLAARLPWLDDDDYLPEF